ncbi:MAG: hypothetical protein JWL67_106, partial [Solirubrobacterales bacterium]|nr:hypothetical protein [Solirubrobacterales bacterium]
MLPFSISIALLSIVQGAVVALPLPPRVPVLARLRSRRWALVPPLSVVVVVFALRGAESTGADGLTYLALVAVPLLAALALGWLTPAARPRRALLVAPLFALAWADGSGLAGQAAALLLSALSCVSLGALLAAITPPRWLAAGIFAMAAADTALVVSDLLQKPNNALNAAHPAAGLPRLQTAVLGSAVMGYGDLFIAGVLGGLLAVTMGRPRQVRGAILTAVLALGFDLLFLIVSELPATVPVATALVVLLLRRRRTGALSGKAPAALSLQVK